MMIETRRSGRAPILWLCISTIVLLNLPFNAHARWFILPGAFYSDEFGIVGSIAFILETQQKRRFDSRLEYFGEQQGQVLLSLFVPEKGREWSYQARYQIGEKDVYLQSTASSQRKQGDDIQYWTELWAGCDFIRNNGLFYGIKGAYNQYAFKKDPQWLFSNIDPNVASGFAEGNEYYSTLRLGLECRDNRYNSRNGYYALWQTDIGVTDDGDEAKNLIRSQIDLRQYFRLAEESVLAVNIRSGIIPQEVPYYSQFRMGGSQSLRGFPVDRYHGNAFYLGRTEFRQIVLKNLPSPIKLLKSGDPKYKDYTFSAGFALFSDFGDLWREDSDWWGFRQNIGFGLRAIFPPDVVASIDIATPLDSDYIAIYLDLRQSF